MTEAELLNEKLRKLTQTTPEGFEITDAENTQEAANLRYAIENQKPVEVGTISGAKEMQKEPLELIEANEMTESERGPIIPVGDLPESKTGEFARVNYNENLLNDKSSRDLYESERGESKALLDKYLKSMGDTKGGLEDKVGAHFTPRRENKIDAQALLEEAQKTLKEADVKEGDKGDLISYMISAFGPGLMGMAVGGQAGYEGGGKGGDQSLKYYQDSLKQKQDKRKETRDSASKQIEAIGKLQEGEGKRIEAEEKSKLDRARLTLDMMKTSGHFDEKAIAVAQNQYNQMLGAEKAADQRTSQNMVRGIDKTLEQEQKDLDRNFKADESKLQRENDLARSKEISKRPAKFAQAKPPTEGERKASSTYGMMANAENEFQNFSQENKVLPSTKNSFTDFFSSLQQVQSPERVFMGTILGQIKDPKLKRQLEIETTWLAPKLRAESGAAISVSEYLMERPIYFPRQGDTPQIIAEKAVARKQSLEGKKAEAGRAPLTQPLTQVRAPHQEIKPKPASKKVGDVKKVQGIEYRWDGQLWQPN